MRLLTLLLVLGVFLANPIVASAGDNEPPTKEKCQQLWDQAVEYSKTLIHAVRRADYQPLVINLDNDPNGQLKIVALLIAALPEEERNELLAKEDVIEKLKYLPDTATTHYLGGLYSDHLGKLLYRGPYMIR